jgi:hypothetical protein
MSGADFTARGIALSGFSKLRSSDMEPGTKLVGHRGSDWQTVGRTLTAKLDDTVSVKDFGAVGDGVADDTAAIRAAIAALNYRASVLSGLRMGMGRLYFPEGVYRITENAVLIDSEYYLRASLVLQGAGPRNSILWLDPSALSAPGWFYDNAATQSQWGMVCEDLCFAGGTSWQDSNPVTNVVYGSSNIDPLCNGFKLTGPGWESAFIFNRCEFRYLQTVFHTAGSNNVDTHRFVTCDILRCNNIVYVDNPQSFSLTWLGCYINGVYGNFLEYGPNSTGGGGNFLMHGGAIIAQTATGDTSTHHVVKLTQGGPALANAPITFSDVRVELRGNYHGFVNSTSGIGIVTARDCSFHSTATVDKNFVTVGGYATVKFVGCAISAGTGGGRLKYVIGTSGDGARGKNASILFTDGCQIPNSLLGTDVTWGSNGGRLLIDETCIDTVTNVAPSSDPKTIAMACDVFGPTSVTGGGLAVSTTHRTRKRYTISPFVSAAQLIGGSGLTGIATQVPLYSRLVEAWVRIEAGQGNANNIRCLIGNDDKSVIYGSTTVGAQNLGQYLKVDLQQLFADTTNKRRIRFWFDNGSGGQSTASSSGRIDGGVVWE